MSRIERYGLRAQNENRPSVPVRLWGKERIVEECIFQSRVDAICNRFGPITKSQELIPLVVFLLDTQLLSLPSQSRLTLVRFFDQDGAFWCTCSLRERFFRRNVRLCLFSSN